MDTVDLDLDTLTRGPKKVKLNGKVIEVSPPDVGELFGLAKMGKKFEQIKAGKGKISDKQALDAYDEMKEGFIRLIPELQGMKVTIDQLFALLKLINEMAIPSDVSAMEAQGIKVDVAEKKILSGSSEKSQGS